MSKQGKNAFEKTPEGMNRFEMLGGKKRGNSLSSPLFLKRFDGPARSL
jgi:hypothetical protein